MTEFTNPALERKLEDLQNSHRLCIHSWEDVPDFGYRGELPEILGVLQHEVTSSEIPGKLQEYPQASLSLLPSRDSHSTIRPYLFSGAIQHRPVHFPPYLSDPRPAYLFDLSQDRRDQKHPGKVLRVSDCALMSGDDVHDKSLQLWDLWPPAAAFYKGKTLEQVLLDAGNDPAFSEGQLDALGEYYETPRNRSKESLRYNEVIAVVAQEHIAAIAIPVSNEHNIVLARLSGAINGLAHLEQGVDLPVVLYHMDGLNAGKCEYIGQGEKELTEIVLDAIKKLHAPGQTNNDDRELFKTYKNIINHQLGIDIDKPLGELNTAAAELFRDKGDERLV